MNLSRRLMVSIRFAQWLILATALVILGGVIGWNLYAKRN